MRRLSQLGDSHRLIRYATLLPVLGIACLALPFRYGNTVLEPDLVRMVAGLVYGEATGLHETAGQHYGLSFSFGYYRLMYWLAPAGTLRDPQATAQLINLMGIVFGLLAIWSCAEYLSALFGRAAGIVATSLAFGSPMMLPVVFSGHPLLPASALLFMAGWMMGRPAATAWARACIAATTMALLVAGLSMRAEIVLAFPFVVLAERRAADSATLDWNSLLWRSLAVSLAFAVFLLLQRPFVATDGGASSTVASYLESAKALAAIGTGLAIWLIGLGIASAGAVAIGLVWLAGSGAARRREVVSVAALSLPALALWLPDPLPARHLFFPALASALLVALAVSSRPWPVRRVATAVLLLVLGNQALAEALHPLVARHYKWPYEPVTSRRSTPRAPTGAFVLDQRSNQALSAQVAEEARRLAAMDLQRLLFFGDAPHDLVAHHLSRDPALRWSDRTVAGIYFVELRSSTRRIVVVQKNTSWPRDVQAEVMDRDPWSTWPVYVQSSTRSAFDRATVDPSRLITLDLAASAPSDSSALK